MLPRFRYFFFAQVCWPDLEGNLGGNAYKMSLFVQLEKFTQLLLPFYSLFEYLFTELEYE